MTIVLYSNASENIVVNKDITEIASYEGYLRDQSSIQNPVVLFELPENATFSAKDVNYLYISEFGRYYYIEEIIQVRTNLWQISTSKCDVLMSFKSDIYSATGILARSSSGKYNTYITDPEAIVTENEYILIRSAGLDEFRYTADEGYVLLVAGSPGQEESGGE